jgi:hypothetical protein
MIKTREMLLSIACFMMSGAVSTDPLRDRLIADARAVSPAALDFDRATNLVRRGGGTETRVAMVERWDGNRWTLVSRNGRPPTAAQKREAEKVAASAPVPGYHRLAALLGTATPAGVDAQGRKLFAIPVLPANSVRTDTADISSHLKAEAIVGERDGRPFVEQLNITARETFKLNALIKVKSFEMTSSYALEAKGPPRLASQSANSVGSVFGIPGGETSKVTFSYR